MVVVVVETFEFPMLVALVAVVLVKRAAAMALVKLVPQAHTVRVRLLVMLAELLPVPLATVAVVEGQAAQVLQATLVEPMVAKVETE